VLPSKASCNSASRCIFSNLLSSLALSAAVICSNTPIAADPNACIAASESLKPVCICSNIVLKASAGTPNDSAKLEN